MRSLPWWQPEIGDREFGLVADVLKSAYINEGEVTDKLEKALAARLGVRHAVATTSGTAAIFLALRGLGIGPGDEVIVPDLTFIATANAVHLTGARPVLVDIDAKTLNISVDATERALGLRTKAIVPVHVSGRGADMQALVDLARARQLVIVEDAAEALLSKHRGKYLGTWGHAGCFSFSPNKTMTTGQGGLVVTDDDKLAVSLRQLKDQGRPVRGTGGDDEHPALGYNFKLTNLQAAVGLAQLSYLDSRMARMKELHLGYRAGLAGVAEVTLPGFEIEQGEAPQWTDAICERRDELERFLTERGAQCRRFWHPVHTHAPYRLDDGPFPTSTALCKKALWLPSAFQLTVDDVDHVCKLVREFYGVRA
jgi:perosamine synthetase